MVYAMSGKSHHKNITPPLPVQPRDYQSTPDGRLLIIRA